MSESVSALDAKHQIKVASRIEKATFDCVWPIERLRFMAKIQNSNIDKKTVEGESSVRLCNYVDVYYNQVIQGEMDFMEASATEDQIQKFKLTKGDVIITKDSESPDDIGIAAYVGESYDNVVCGYHLTMLKPYADVDGKFLYYALSNDLTAGQFKVAANGVTRFGLSQDGIKSVLLPKPDVSTQKKVASFLDKKTKQIDDLIAKKEQLLKLLAEKRTSLITQAVTKGLDPTVKMKDSGVEWLGEIPEGWVVGKVCYWYNVQLGKMLQPEPKGDDDMLKPYLRAANIAWGAPKLEDVKTMWFRDSELEKYKLQKGDVLVSEGGDVGRASYWTFDQEMYIQNAVNRLRPLGTESNSRYLYYWMYFLKHHGLIDIMCNSSTIAHYTAEKVKATPMLHPLPEQQREISDYLDGKIAQLRALMAKLKQSVVSLQDYRSNLIQQAVTGKLNLTNYDQTS